MNAEQQNEVARGTEKKKGIFTGTTSYKKSVLSNSYGDVRECEKESEKYGCPLKKEANKAFGSKMNENAMEN